MLAWLMNLDFAGGSGGSGPTTTTVLTKKRGGSGRQWAPVTFLLAVFRGG